MLPLQMWKLRIPRILYQGESKELTGRIMGQEPFCRKLGLRLMIRFTAQLRNVRKKASGRFDPSQVTKTRKREAHS